MALSVLACANSGTAVSSRLFANNSDTAKPTGKASKPNEKEPVSVYPEYITTDTGRACFVKGLNRGKIIYKQTCAKYHMVTKKGKVYYSSFSIPQLIDYEMQIQYPEQGMN